MNKSLLAFAALASFAGTATATESIRLAPTGPGVVTADLPKSAQAGVPGTANPHAAASAVAVLGELQVTTVAAACGCYGPPTDCH